MVSCVSGLRLRQRRPWWRLQPTSTRPQTKPAMPQARLSLRTTRLTPMQSPRQPPRLVPGLARVWDREDGAGVVAAGADSEAGPGVRAPEVALVVVLPQRECLTPGLLMG